MLEDELVVRARSRVGRVLREKYRLVALLGVGGMAAVYAAQHLRNANRVAVKILHPEISLDAALRERFLREGYAANTVDHPGTVRVLDDDTAEDGCAFLVMELLEGETVEARAERCGRLSVLEVVAIARSLLEVLHAAHQKGIVHRDVKPENLFITRDGALKLLDFGVARLAAAGVRRTRSGAIFGTPAYMPPEQALGRTREMDALTDVWAVGATAFTLLSGRLVHDAESGEEMMVRAATRPAPRLASVAPHVPESVARIVDRALEYDRRERWPSALAMMAALEDAQREIVASGAGAVDASWIPDDRTTAPTVPVASTVGGVATQRAAAGTGWRTRSVLLAAAGVPLLVGAALVVAMRAPRTPASPSATAASSIETVVPLPPAGPPAVVETAPAPSSASSSSPSPPSPSSSPSPSPAMPVASLRAAAAPPSPTPVQRSPAPPPVASSPPRKRDPLAP